MLIKNVTNLQLAPTLKEIIFQLAGRYYPREWPEIVSEALKILSEATDFSQIMGCVEALKAVFSVFGGSISQEIELSNLCNRAMLPLFGLISNLFQSFYAETAVIMVAAFKLFSTALHFHIPPIIQANIHNLMIFLKKIVDLSVPLHDTSVYTLKKISLRILFRMYQRHANPKLTSSKDFAALFHKNYTKSFVESLIFQVMSEGGSDKAVKHRHMELVKLSLSCLAYINRQHAEAAALLIQHREAIVNLCLQRFRLNFGKGYQNFMDFKLEIQERRVHLKEFFFSLMRCEAFPQQEDGAVTALLGILLNCLQHGDNELKELALYIFSEMSTEVQFLSSPLEEKMTLLITAYVRPLLKEENHLLVRARACQLLASYNYLDLPEESLVEIATLVYNCLLVGSSEKENFLKVYACNAFNGLLKHAQIIAFIKPHLHDILRIYTSLLEADVSIIKNFEDLLNLLEEDIAPFANDLVQLLINLYHNYSKQDGPSAQQGLSYGAADDEENEEDDTDSLLEEDDNNNENIAKACISSVRQILQAERTELSGAVSEELFGIVVNIFVDRSQLYIEEGYNILNLLLFKLKGQVQPKYYLFLKVIVYAILGVPQDYLASLRKGSNFDRQFADIVENICLEPDNDLIENCVGCVRNFIAKSSRDMLWAEKDDFNRPLMDCLFKVVKAVHENQHGRSSQTDRLIILTLYITLLEHRVLGEQEVAELVDTVLRWLQMEQEAVQRSHPNFSNEKPQGFVYSPVYLQIVMVGVHFYGNAVISQVNVDSLLLKVVALQDCFKCDYEIGRVLIGVADLLQAKCVGEQGVAAAVMQALPELVRRLCKLRTEGEDQLNDAEMDDEAEEEKFFGEDENSMMVGWQGKGATANDLQLREEEEEEDNDWEEEFNKFYDSPLDQVDEVRWLESVLKGAGSSYCGLLDQRRQEELALYFLNAPAKNGEQ